MATKFKIVAAGAEGSGAEAGGCPWTILRRSAACCGHGVQAAWVGLPHRLSINDSALAGRKRVWPLRMALALTGPL